jgi:hypothetical protein
MLRLSARRRRWVIKCGSVLVLLLAVLPQVLYLGHPRQGSPAAAEVGAMPAGHEHHQQAAAEHANHCHVGPKGCAGADGVTHVALLGSLISIAPEGPGFDTLEQHQSTQGFLLWQRPEKPPQAI